MQKEDITNILIEILRGVEIGCYHPQYEQIIGQKIKFSPYVENECKIVGYEVDRTTLCQCTGLKDKHGTLIWENDIVRYCDFTEELYVIAWEEKKSCFEYQQYGCSITNFDELSGIEVEVIGSYIDNPELLEVE